MKKNRAGRVLLALISLLGGCIRAPASAPETTSPPARSRFVSPRYGIAVDYPAGLHAARTFEPDHFLGTRWNPDAPDDVRGAPLLALTLPGSNRVTRGVLRLGASDDPRALAGCRLPAQPLRGPPGKPQTISIGGVAFTRVDSGDAGMSHYEQRQSYRTVHAGRCIAIDLIVTGTHPQVYDPPRHQPFKPAAAWARLQALLGGVHLGE